MLVELLVPTLQARGVRGLLVRSGRRGQRHVARGWGEEPPDEILVREQGMVLCTPVRHGQKTGLFLDHRTSRRTVRRIAAGLRVLDLYAYVGGFSAAAGLGGASSVTTVDVAPRAIELAERTWVKNGLDESQHTCMAADVPEYLTAQTEAGNRFELIIADPPSFAPNQGARSAALRAYMKLHQASIGLLAPGGYYLAASCSSHIDARDFEDGLIEGADKARRNMQVLDRWGAPPDHPRLLGFPEGDYLKVALLKAVD
jgi:23S rRNA (cytosine1962-C5)-methyltransferase